MKRHLIAYLINYHILLVTFINLRDLPEPLPVWLRMVTIITLLTTFEGREISIKQRLEDIKKK